MREIGVPAPFTCTPVCRAVFIFESLAAAIGPAGDVLYVPLSITGGRVTGKGSEKRILGGSDFAMMYADEKLVHDGNCVVTDPMGDILLWYGGFSQAQEGAYDALLDGRLPAKAQSHCSVRIVSTNPQWRFLNRKPLLGIGSFDGNIGILELTILMVTADAVT